MRVEGRGEAEGGPGRHQRGQERDVGRTHQRGAADRIEAVEEGEVRADAGQGKAEQAERGADDGEGGKRAVLPVDQEDEREGGGCELDRGGERQCRAGRDRAVFDRADEGDEDEEGDGDRRLVVPEREIGLDAEASAKRPRSVQTASGIAAGRSSRAASGTEAASIGTWMSETALAKPCGPRASVSGARSAAQSGG